MKKLVYFGDPMCSWCYGFAPTLTKLHNNYSDRLDMSVVTGGLYTGGNTYQNESRIAFLKKTWKRIEQLSGQPFNYSMLETKGWLYDTELSCRAIVAMRRLQPELVFDYFHLVQTNFYVNARDAQIEETFQDAAAELGADSDEFLREIQSDECVAETRRDFLWSKEMGVSGYPTILLNDGQKWGLLSSGYQEFPRLQAALDKWLDN